MFLSAFDIQHLISLCKKNFSLQNFDAESPVSPAGLWLFSAEVKPRDNHEADDDDRRAEFVTELKEIFPVVAEHEPRPKNERSPRQRARECVEEERGKLHVHETDG